MQRVTALTAKMEKADPQWVGLFCVLAQPFFEMIALFASIFKDKNTFFILRDCSE